LLHGHGWRIRYNRLRGYGFLRWNVIVATKSLRTRFLLITIPAMVVLVVGMIGGFEYIVGRIIDGLSERFAVQRVYYDRSRTLALLLQEMALARKMAHSPAIISWIENETDPAATGCGLAELESYREAFRDSSYFLAIRKSGNYYFNDAKNSYAGQQLRYTLSEKSPNDSWFYATLKSPKECLLNVNYDTELKITNVWINCLVRGKDGQAIGLAGTGIELDSFIRANFNPLHDGVVNMFIDTDGAIQAHPDVSKIDFHTITKDPSAKKTVFRLITDDDSRMRLQKLMVALKESPDEPKTTYLKINGTRTLVGAAYVKEIGWYNLTVLDPRVWALGQSFWPLAALMVAGMLITLLVAAVFIDRTVLSRIDRLDRAVKRVKDGNYEVYLRNGIGDQKGDEIARLSSSFSEMTGMVQRDRAELERKIAERTRELVKARDEAQAANRAKSEFLAMMSHDLRTPLNAIIGFSDMIRSKTFGPVGDSHYETYVQDIHESGHMLLSLINVLLDISKIEAGKMELNETSVDLASFLADLARQIEPFAAARGVGVEIATEPASLALRCDRRSLTQVVNNLVSNAIKFSNPNQTVTVRAAVNAEGELAIVIEDHGIGMNAEDIEMALEPFAQVRSSEARNQDGTGLGLHVSKLLMRMHGGRLDIESSLGVGTVVSAVFPAERVEANGATRTKSAAG
jgi:signal transduction histidine kinase